MGMFITEPYRGDFAVKLKAGRKHTTDEVIAGFRHTFHEQFPAFHWDFPGILTDVIGDLQSDSQSGGDQTVLAGFKMAAANRPSRGGGDQIHSRYCGHLQRGLAETGPSINFRVQIRKLPMRRGSA